MYRELEKNEQNYLHDFFSGNYTYMIQQLMCRGKVYREDCVIFANKYYSECIEEYNEFIKLSAKLLSELKANDNPIVLSMLLRILILRGYFSVKNKFTSTSYGCFDVFHHLGMDIVGGKGCCRHVANFYNDIFNELGVTGDILFGIVTTDKDFSLKQALSSCSNHVLNTLFYDDIVYGYDFFSDNVLKFINSFVMRAIISEDKSNDYEKEIVKMYYKISTNMMFGVYREEILKKLKIFLESSKRESIDYVRCKEFKDNAYDIFYSNKYLLRDFKRCSKKLKREIAYDMEASYIASKSDSVKN